MSEILCYPLQKQFPNMVVQCRINSGKQRRTEISLDARSWKKQMIDRFTFEGSGIVRDEDKRKISRSTSTPATAIAIATPPFSVSFEGCMAEVPLSPRRALRAAMLKERFADTISKAKLIHGIKSDVLEKARTEVQIKAGQAALRRKAQRSLKMSRDRERKAARLALQKMKKTADFGNTASILKDLEILCRRPATMGYPNANTLERLGLYMKKDNYLEEGEGVEDGEILL